jgi:Domain of unknown function (DUF4430)
VSSRGLTLNRRDGRVPVNRPVFLGTAVGLALVAAAALCAAPVWSAEPANPAGSAAMHDTVALVVDFGDGSQKAYPAIPWHAGMTVWDLLVAAEHLPHPIAVRKTGLTRRDYFVTRIDDATNEGGGSGKRNWLYWLDGAMAQMGVGTQQVNAGQTVLFKFALPDQAS